MSELCWKNHAEWTTNPVFNSDFYLLKSTFSITVLQSGTWKSGVCRNLNWTQNWWCRNHNESAIHCFGNSQSEKCELQEKLLSVSTRSRSAPSEVYSSFSNLIQCCQKWQYCHQKIGQQGKKLCQVGLNLMITGWRDYYYFKSLMLNLPWLTIE